MSDNARFTASLFALLILAWGFSGDRLLDAVFAMPDLGPVDDSLIALTVTLEDWKAALHLPDAFTALRSALHRLLGL